MPMETMVSALERLRRAGYDVDLEPDGVALKALGSERRFEPEELVVEEVLRFEGESDPADEATLYALRSADGEVRGTWCATYGTYGDPDQDEIQRRLPDAHRWR